MHAWSPAYTHSGPTAPVGPMGMYSVLSPLYGRSRYMANLMRGCAMEKPYSRFS